MKKYIIIAAAALVAAAACSEVENKLETPEEAISFKVVDYATATRAGDNYSLIKEGIKQFTTYAWIHADGNATGNAFMNAEVVKPDSETSPTEWAPSSRTYYWPKSAGTYINFFSFAGTKLPASMATEGTVSFDNVTIATDDNILVADAAYRYTKNNNPATYKMDGVKEGVPTLFHHMLSKVYFDVNLDATGVTDTKYKFTVSITEAKVSYANKGTLTLTFKDPESTGQAPFKTEEGWVAGTTTGTLSGTAVTLTANGGAKYPAADAEKPYLALIDTSTVMPQVLSVTTEATETTEATTTYPVTVSLKYTLKTQYNEDAGYTETIEVKDVPLAQFTPSITEWAMNYKYIYHITINPVSGEKILFDPAVVPWEVAEAASITVPVK